MLAKGSPVIGGFSRFACCRRLAQHPPRRTYVVPSMTLNDQLVTALADRYRVDRELGSGGMATVYLAHDVRHDRKVAIKVLKPELAAVIGGARFLAEIKTTANLQHPHILPLHDSGEVAGTVFYVMPFIDGESLRDRLNREKQLPIPVAVRIATEVADALQYAHTHGVIHRDIKPENILLQNGHALVADFGIALAASTAGSRMTETGMSLGTPHYMSPEQAMGERDLDARTDIYALGCVLYEMLTGQPPFTGPTAQAIVAKVITEKPVLPSKLRSSVGEDLESAILTALEKLPADRFATAAEVSAAIVDGPGTAPRRVARRKDRDGLSWKAVSFGLAGATVLAIAVAAWAMMSRGGQTVGPVSYDAALPDSALMSFGAAAQSGYGLPFTDLSISPDGTFAVYTSARGDSTSLWYRSLRDGSAHQVAGTAGGVLPAISPDGKQIAFLNVDQVMIVPVGGGTAKPLMVSAIPAQIEWDSPAKLLIIDTDGTRLTTVDPESGPVSNRTITRCQFSKWIRGKGELACSGNMGTGYIVNPADSVSYALRVENADGSVGPVMQGSDFRIVDDKYVVYVSPEGEIHGASFDLQKRLVGRGVPLVSGVRREHSGDGQFDISASGDLVYAPGVNAGIGTLAVGRPNAEPMTLPVAPSAFQRFDLSRDKRWLAAVVQAKGNQELRIYNLRDGQSFVWLRAPLIRHPLWSPDGATLLVYVRDSSGAAIVSGNPRSNARVDTVFAHANPETVPDIDEYVDDRTVLGLHLASATVTSLDPTVRPAKPVELFRGSRFATIAPGGKLIVYQDPDGQVKVTRYPMGGDVIQVARGVEPLWLSSSEFIYRSGVTWYSMRVDPATGEPRGAPVLFTRDPRFNDTSGWSNRPSHDGGIIYVRGPEESTARYLRVLPNWVSRMKAAVDSAGS